MKTGAELVQEERERQVSEEGYSAEHDRMHVNGEIALTAIAYAAPHPVYLMKTDDRGIHFVDPWIWDAKWDKRKNNSRIRRTVVAAAMLCAEIDRLLQVEARYNELQNEYDSLVGATFGSESHRRQNEVIMELKKLEDQLA